MRTTVSALLALLMLASPVAAFVAAQEPPVRERDLQVVLSSGPADRFGGGEWVKIEVGNTIFAVMYGNESRPNTPKIFVEYDRYLGVAEIYNTSGDLLVRRPLPVRTIMVQSFDLMLEFADPEGTAVWDVPRDVRDYPLGGFDLPRKALSLRQAWSLDAPPARIDEGALTQIDFNVSAYDLRYDLARLDENVGDGMLNRITFAFHVTIDRVRKTLDVTFYRIVVDENRHPVEILAPRTESLTGVVVNGTFKYDHYIEGWDWGGPDRRLAMVTHVLVGNQLPESTARFIHLAHDLHVRTDTTRHDQNNTLQPKLITADTMRFEDEWTRVGRLQWVSDVEVDGVLQRMKFQLHRVEPVRNFYLRFGGLLFGGAFVYPQGDVIYHDPSLQASVFVPIGVDAGGLAPYFIQLGVVGLAIVGLVAYRALRRKPQA